MKNRQILHGDVLQKIKEIPDGSIDCIITSPPYWGLRDYGVRGQIGLESDYRDFLKTMRKIMKECYRVLKSTGTCWVNFGDSYSGPPSGSGPDDCRESFTFETAPKQNTKIKQKSLMGIPQRFFINCIDDGWVARNDISWIKSNHMPSSKTDGFTSKHEYIFFFAKTPKTSFYYNSATGEARNKTPVKMKLGEDYDLVSCKNISKTCNFCKGVGERKKSFWHSVNYYFNLDAVRIVCSAPNLIENTASNKVIQHDLDGNVIPNHTKSRKAIMREKYEDIPSSNVTRLHKDRDGNPNKVTDAEDKKDEFKDMSKNRKLSKQTISKVNSNSKNMITGESLNHPLGKNPGDIFDFRKKFEDGKWRGHYDKDGNCLGCGKSWKKHTASKRAKGSMHEASKRTEDIVWCNSKGKNPGDVVSSDYTDAELLEWIKICREDESAWDVAPPDLWYINPKPFSKAHFATFPVDLPKRALLCGCAKRICKKCGKPRIAFDKSEKHTKCNCNAGFKPGVVLDIFFGAGTTAVAAEQLGLQWVGIEINREYIDIARKRLAPYLDVKLDISS